ncbi:TetR DNA-binding transcription regulator [Corynebacterium variabile DSM 44702]|uniref:TetR DNA-binding transcription regulator n=1 Tax=Corynebacterium variabile (strain DSM 44702 / CIP 107183 / JCM 12073 / NCIMB 30131) TaxID=858619 RepID=G0HFQ7_CORVD|nr:TetR/AcrR family transcriptional regulator [Corynebacterium variabile]AEK37310.1 TetR DNA-binding transcription regulator [Corynebacterium variabile DSM 44702]
MARPRSFNEDAVLDAAAAQFRVHGFADTSTEQLCEAAGVRRSSLYNTFTSKDTLFVRALERYLATTGDRQAAILEDENRTGGERLDALLDLIISEEEDATVKGHAAGCMAVASRMSPDLSEHDPHVRELLDRGLTRQLSLIEGTVASGVRDGSLRPELDPEDAALTVVSLISGLRVMSQAETTPETLHRIAELTLSALRR